MGRRVSDALGVEGEVKIWPACGLTGGPAKVSKRRSADTATFIVTLVWRS